MWGQRWILRGTVALALVLCASVRSPARSAPWVTTIRSAPELQAQLDRVIRRLAQADPHLDERSLRVALIDLRGEGAPRLAQRHGNEPVYPASVVKFVYLMAAYAWRDRGQLAIDDDFDRTLDAMIYRSSNQATQKVLRRLTETRAGPALPPAAYDEFREKRLSIKRWLAELGIEDLHCIHPTYDGNGDLFGRDRQLLQDPTVPGGLPSRSGEFANRQSMTAVETARLLALLATDRALSSESSAAVRKRMRRNPDHQKYLVNRIAGGARRCDRELVVESKTGTFGRIIADAGIIRAPDGHELILVVFIDSSPRYRGAFIANLAEAISAEVLGCAD